jgi:hypothetical protein
LLRGKKTFTSKAKYNSAQLKESYGAVQMVVLIKYFGGYVSNGC